MAIQTKRVASVYDDQLMLPNLSKAQLEQTERGVKLRLHPDVLTSLRLQTSLEDTHIVCEY